MDRAAWLWVEDPRRAAAFLIAAALTLALAALLATAPVWRLYGLLPTRALHSDRLRISHALATRWLDETPDVLLLGGSQVREMLPRDDFIAAELSEKCGRPVSVFNAASSAQLPETSWAIVEHFHAHPPTLVVIGTNLWRVADDAARIDALALPLFLLPRATTMPADSLVLPLSPQARIRNRLGIVFADILTAVRGLSLPPDPSGSPFAAPQHQYRAPGWSPERKAMEGIREATLARAVPAYTLERSLRSYLALSRLLPAGSSRIGYLVTPYSPEVGAPFQELEPKLVAAVGSLAAAGDVLDTRRAAGLSSADFYDTLHLLETGRRKLWPTLRAFLLSGLRDCGAQ